MNASNFFPRMVWTILGACPLSHVDLWHCPDSRSRPFQWETAESAYRARSPVWTEWSLDARMSSFHPPHPVSVERSLVFWKYLGCFNGIFFLLSSALASLCEIVPLSSSSLSFESVNAQNERSHFHPRGSGRCPNGQCLLGVVLPRAWNSARWTGNCHVLVTRASDGPEKPGHGP